MMRAHIALFTVAFIYGANYSIAKEVMNNGYVEPLGFILLRVSAAVVVFCFIQRAFIRERIQRKDIWRFILCGLFGVAINQMCFFTGLKFTTPINASLIMTTTPILVLISSALIIGEKITWQKMIGIACGAAGAILLIAYGKNVRFAENQFFGDLLIFINACSYGIYLVLVKTLMSRYHPFTVVSCVFVVGWFAVLPFGFNEVASVAWSSFPLSIWLAFLFVIIFATLFTYFLNAYALSLVNPSVVSIYIYLQPLLASAIALLFAKDVLDPLKIFAGFLIFSGVYMVSRSSGSVSENPGNGIGEAEKTP